MHGRVWIVPLLVLFWLAPSFSQHDPWTLLLQAAADDGTLSSESSPKLTQKKRSAVKKAPRAQPRSSSAPRSRSTPRHLSGSPSGEQPPKSPTVRRYAAENALLRRLAAAGLLRQSEFESPRVLDTWRIRLVDGDTFWYGGERIRIRGYNAPERSQPGGFDATQRLEALLREGEVRMYPHGLDTYGRTLADVYVEQRNVAEVMIEEGYAKKR